MALNISPPLIPILSEVIGQEPCYLPNPMNLPIFNPGAAKFKKNYIFISRCSNILNYEDGNYFYESKPHNTINVLHYFNENCEFLNTSILNDDFLKQNFSCVEYGVEDIRLFNWRNGLWGIGAGIGDGANGRVIRQVLFEIKDSTVVSGFELASPHNRIYEKNWAPLVNKDSLNLVYQIDPVEIYSFQNGKIVGELIPKEINNSFDIKGSTPFIPLNNHWLGLVHAGPFKSDDRLFYTHRFCLLDAQFRRMDLSQPFFLQRRGIEFACGLINDGSSLLISYGASDRASAFIKMPIGKLKNWIISPPLI
jgi:hypothetical protein